MSTKTIVIIGGGFAGTRLAQRLERKLPKDWSIALLSCENFITFSPLLPEVVGASLLPGHVVAPLRQMLYRTRLYMVQVTRIDLAERTVHYLGKGAGNLRYDHLVLACGQSANLAMIEGMASYALPLKTLGDSLFLRNRLIVCLEQAELERDPEIRRWSTTFIVIGGGFSGVEVAGGLADFLRATASGSFVAGRSWRSSLAEERGSLSNRMAQDMMRRSTNCWWRLVEHRTSRI